MDTPFRQEAEEGQSAPQSRFGQLQTKITNLLAAYEGEMQAAPNSIPVELEYADKFRFLLIEVAATLADQSSANGATPCTRKKAGTEPR